MKAYTNIDTITYFDTNVGSSFQYKVNMVIDLHLSPFRGQCLKCKK